MAVGTEYCRNDDVAIRRSGNIRGCRRTIRSCPIYISHIITRDLGNVPRNIYTAEIHRTVGVHDDPTRIAHPHGRIQRILPDRAIIAESRRDGNILVRRRSGARRCGRFDRSDFIDVRHGITRHLGSVARCVYAAKIHRPVLFKNDTGCIVLPKHTVITVFSFNRICAESCRHGNIFIRQHSNIGIGVGTVGNDFVDVCHSIARYVRNVPRRIDTAEIHRTVSAHHHAGCVTMPVFAIKTVLFLFAVITECSGDGHILICRCNDIGAGGRFLRRDLVDIRHRKTCHLGDVPRRIDAAKIHRAVSAHHHAG